MSTEHNPSSTSPSKAIRFALVGATLVTALSLLLVRSERLSGLVILLATVISFPWVFLIFIAVVIFGEHQLLAFNRYLGSTNDWGTVVIAYTIGVWGGALINLRWLYVRSNKSNPPASSSTDGSQDNQAAP
jgi:hypothetical protein